MQNTGLVMVLFLSALTGCDQKPADKTLSCTDSPARHPTAEQRALADACFRRGVFKKSTVQEW